MRQPDAASTTVLEHSGPLFAQRNYSHDRSAYGYALFRMNEDPRAATQVATLQSASGNSLGEKFDSDGSWAIASGRQNLNRLGGHPAWVQSAEYPDCPDCGRAMGFLLQLEAGLPGAEGGAAFDEGVLYGYWGDACRVSAYVVQMS
jgi:hypothetical protein